MNAASQRKKKKLLIKELINIKAKQDWGILLAVLALVVGGFIMVTSAYGNVYVRYGPRVFAFSIVRIVGFIIIGFLIMQFLARNFNQYRQKNLVNLISFIVCVMMGATLFFEEQNGAQAWVRFGPFSLQPVEFLKVIVIVQFARYFSNPKLSVMSMLDVVLKPLIAFIAMGVFIVGAQNDLGNFLIITMIYFVLFLMIPDYRFKWFKISFSAVGIISVLALYIFGHSIADWVYSLEPGATGRLQLLRIAVLFDPLRDVFVSGFQVTNALVALSSAGLFGSGLNTSMAKTILPEPYNDAIIAVITEETGLIGVIVLFFLYGVIINRLISYSLKIKNNQDRIVLMGIATFFMAQFFVNIGGMVGLIPMTGVTLLFVSSGGSSILTAFVTMGIAQSIIAKYIK